MYRPAKDIAVALEEDQPGALARAIHLIATAGVHIEGYAEIGGILHVVTNDPTTALRALESAGYEPRGQSDVLVVDLHELHGGPAEILWRIANAAVNVDFTYYASKDRMVVGTSNLERVVQALRKEVPPTAENAEPHVPLKPRKPRRRARAPRRRKK